MPSSITHQLIAEEARDLFPAVAKRAAEEAPDEFFLGCQGPDVFFFYRIGCRSEYNLGKFMHRFRIYDVFTLFLQAIRGENGAPRLDGTARTRVLAYVLGYLTHYAADSTFHPFVYRYLAENGCEKGEHQQIENDWDVYFLRELRGKEAEKFGFGFSREKIVKDGSVARLYAFLSERLEREETTRRRFNAAVKNFCRYLSFFHGKCYGAQRRWLRTEKIFHAKRRLSRLYPREAPEPGYLYGEHFADLAEGRGESADALFARAVNESARLAALFCEAVGEGTLPRADFSLGLLTGRPIAEQ